MIVLARGPSRGFMGSCTAHGDPGAVPPGDGCVPGTVRRDLLFQGKVFPKLRKRSPQGSAESTSSDKEDDEATDYVFRIVYPSLQSEFGKPPRPWAQGAARQPALKPTEAFANRGPEVWILGPAGGLESGSLYLGGIDFPQMRTNNHPLLS